MFHCILWRGFVHSWVLGSNEWSPTRQGKKVSRPSLPTEDDSSEKSQTLSHIRTDSNTLCPARQRLAERMIFQQNPVLPEFFLSKTQCDTYLWDILLTVSREFHQQPNWSCHLEPFTLEKGATMRSVITAGDMESIRVGASTLKTAPTISTTHTKTSAEVKTARKSVLNKSSISGHAEGRRYITLFKVWFYLVSFMGHQWKCLSERPTAEYVEMCVYTYIRVLYKCWAKGFFSHYLKAKWQDTEKFSQK